MNFRLAVFSGVLLTCLASRHSKEPQKDKNITNRQQIFGRNRGNDAMSQVGDLITQLNKQQQQNSNSGVVELSPSNADAVNGLTGAGIGLPFGTMNSRIDKNPLIGANGLTKNSLSDIMFGNFKGLATLEGNDAVSSQPESVQGGSMRQMLGGQTNNLEELNNGNGMGNGVTNLQPINLGALVAANNMAAAQGLNGFSLNNGGMNGLSMSSGTPSSLGLNSLIPNIVAPQGAGMNGFPGGPMPVPNPAMGMQMMSQLNNMNQNPEDDESTSKHHKRHHKNHHHRKSTTKLLLRLLVDKMKDIYELDKMTASSKNKKIKSESLAGKIGLTLDDLAILKGKVHPGGNDTDSDFKTKLSFPVTVSDSSTPDRLHLSSEDKTDQNSKTKTDDDASIEKILARLQIKDQSDANNEASKKSGKLRINDLTESVSKDIAKANNIEDSKLKSLSEKTTPAIKGQEIKTENPKSRDNIETIVQDLKNEEAGSLSEFHKVKLDKNLFPESMPGIESDLTPEEKSYVTSKTSGILGFNNNYPKVTAPEIFSVSSILNGGTDNEDTDAQIPISSKLSKSLQDSIPDATKRKTFPFNPSGVKILPLVPSDIRKGEDTLQSLTESISNDVTSKVKDGADYVKAARVLGSVFKKVKDPVAKNSIETAIKAMLQVMRYKTKEENGTTSKKHHFPSVADSKLLEQIHNLNNVVKQMTKRVHSKRKKKLHINVGRY